MSTTTLPNIRVSSDLTVRVRLKDGGVYIDWSTLNNIKAHIYSDAQRALAGRCDVSVDAEDSTLLVCSYAANKPQYVGVNRIVVSAKYMGETKTYDKPAFNFVRWTADQEGEEITIDDPDVDVEIEVEDVTSSILQEAIDAALQAAADAEHAAHLVPLEVLQDCEQATADAIIATAAANAAGIDEVQATVDAQVGTPSVDVDLENKVLSLDFHNMKGETGEAAGFGTASASLTEDGGDPGVTVSASGPDTAKQFAFTFKNLKGDKGDKGDQGNTGASVDYPYELVNNCTTNDATKGLAASQGVALAGEVSQLEAEVADSMAVEILSGTYPVAASLGYIPCSFKQGKKYVVGFSWEYTSGGLAYLVVRQGSGPLVNITPNYYTSRGSEKVYFNAESDYNNLIVINYGGETASGNVTLSVKESYVSEDIKSDIDTVNGNIGTINNEISNLRQELTNDVSQFETKVDIETGKLIVNYPVVAGGSNAKDIKGNFEAGVYGVLVRNIDTQNSGTYSIYINPSSALFGLRTNCTIGIERTISLQSDATILGVEDINPSITTSGNMEIIIRRIDSNESIIERRNNIEENYSTRLFGDFINGTLGDGGAYSIYQAENRVCSISMLNYNRDIVLTAQNGVIFGIHYFDDQGTWLGDSGWISDSLTVYKNTNFKVVVNNGTNPLSIKSALDNILVTNLSNNTQTKLSVTGQGGTGILTDFQIGENRVLKFSIPERWDITNVGSIDNNVITVGYKIGDNRVDIFQRTKRRLDSEGWPTEFFIELPSFSIDGFYIFLRVDSGKTATIYYDIYNYGKLDVPTIYQGQRIEIGMRYALSVIGRMTDYGTPSAQINAQGMAVYGDRYLIQGSNKVGVGTHFIIIDLQEKTLNTILFESQTSGQGFHMNNINLGGKYAESDILPLAYCSECYNEKTCKVVRFSNTFDSFTIIQTIKYSGTTIQEQNYMDWILDYENNKIYAFKDRDNGLDLFGFNLPTLDNNNVVLGDADIIETIRIPNTTGASLLTQGGTIINGKLWTAFGADTTTYPGLLVISDLKLQQMVSFVDLSGLGECEAVGVYEKGVLLCCASGGLNAVSLSNPAYAYMIFNV